MDPPLLLVNILNISYFSNKCYKRANQSSGRGWQGMGGCQVCCLTFSSQSEVRISLSSIYTRTSEQKFSIAQDRLFFSKCFLIFYLSYHRFARTVRPFVCYFLKKCATVSLPQEVNFADSCDQFCQH